MGQSCFSSSQTCYNGLVLFHVITGKRTNTNCFQKVVTCLSKLSLYADKLRMYLHLPQRSQAQTMNNSQKPKSTQERVWGCPHTFGFIISFRSFCVITALLLELMILQSYFNHSFFSFFVLLPLILCCNALFVRVRVTPVLCYFKLLCMVCYG